MAKVSLKPRGGPSVRWNWLFVFRFDAIVNGLAIGTRRLLEDRGQRGAGVFGIDVDASGENALVGDVGAAEIEAALDGELGLVFDLLGDDFSEDDLLGEVLASDDDAGAVGCRRGEA